MKSINTYYEDFQTLQAFLTKQTIEDSPSLLIQVFTSKNDKSFIQTLLNELTTVLPQATIIGSTTDGEIMNAEVSTHKTVLSFTQFKCTTLKTDITLHTKDGYFSGMTLAKSLIQEDTKLLIAFTDGLHTNGEAFLEGIHSVNSDVIVAGGLAGDNAAFTETYVFTKDHIMMKGAVAVSLNSNSLTVSNGYSFNWHRIGKELTITKAKDNRVYTINNKTAVEIYAYYLGEDIATELPAVGVEFPLMFTRNGIEVARAVLAKHDDGSLVFAGNLHTGDKVQFGYGNPLDILENSDDLFHQLQEKPSEAIFIYSCMARRHFMPDTIHEEIKPLQSIAPTSGFFTYGEFYTGEKKELLNQTMTIVSLSEDNIVSSPKANFLPHKRTTTSSINALINLVNRTSQEAMEKDALEQARLTFEKLFEKSPDGILLLEDDIFVQCNQKMLDLFGYTTTEKFVNASAYTLFPRKQPDGSYSLIKLKKMRELAKKNGSHQFEWVHIKENGETFWVDIMLTYLVMNKKEIIYMVYRDITHRKELEDENISIKERQDFALIGSRTSVLDWDFRANSMYISPSWKEMLGYRDDELPNATWTWFKQAHPDDKKEIFSSLRMHEEKQIRYFEKTHRLKHKDGHWVWVLGRAQIFYDENGKKLRMVGTHTDITEEKVLQLKY
ncbi:MAG: FIST N-terminal domain-containing protein, partial [Campylobacterota bacterium]